MLLFSDRNLWVVKHRCCFKEMYLCCLHNIILYMLLVYSLYFSFQTEISVWHSCQPLLGVNLSLEFVDLHFPCAGRGLVFFAGGSGTLNSNWHMWQWKEEAMLCEIHIHDFRSYFLQDFLAYCTRPVSVHLAMACVGCSFDSFSIFLLSLKQQNLMKIMFSCIRFQIWPYPPK